MKTLIVSYSKTGNTRKVAERVHAKLLCDWDEIQFDPNAHAISTMLNPAEYERVLLMCPIWGFRLPEPMTLYLRQHKADIAHYRLVATCGGLGLRGCVSGCRKILQRPPEMAVKIRAKAIKDGAYAIEDIIK